MVLTPHMANKIHSEDEGDIPDIFSKNEIIIETFEKNNERPEWAWLKHDEEFDFE